MKDTRLELEKIEVKDIDPLHYKVTYQTTKMAEEEELIRSCYSLREGCMIQYSSRKGISEGDQYELVLQVYLKGHVKQKRYEVLQKQWTLPTVIRGQN